MKRETRNTYKKLAKASLRMDGDDIKAIEGYAAVFYRAGDPGTEYPLWHNYLERIMPGAFDRALSESHDARADFNHNQDILLGRVSSGTCVLSVDDTGLRYSIEFDTEDTDHKNVSRKIARRDVTGSSFTFSNASADWEELNEDGETVWIRNITDLDLHGVGPVTWPAYEATEAGVRSAVSNHDQLVEARSLLDVHLAALDSHRKNQADAMEIDYRMRQIEQSKG